VVVSPDVPYGAFEDGWEFVRNYVLGVAVVMAVALTGCDSDADKLGQAAPPVSAASATRTTAITTTTVVVQPPEAATVLSARAVVDAITAEGLPVANPRDTTAQLCKDWGCLQLITTDQFSVYQFADAAQASRVANIFPSGYVNGLIFLRFTRDGSHPTDPAMIPRYRAVLDRLSS